ncbi:hypothetical protein [Lancefieldella parvula]|uniref:hypothetical protein n=1 Tax=Lancefieldella parvula TaxID=1382 RepID=UPI0012E0A4EE|nr:hypothetical protein [Lancefieldella parvula]
MSGIYKADINTDTIDNIGREYKIVFNKGVAYFSFLVWLRETCIRLCCVETGGALHMQVKGRVIEDNLIRMLK